MGEHREFGPEIVEETTEVIRRIRFNLKTAQDRQKSYADWRRRDFSLEVGDLAFLRVQAVRGHVRFGQSGKLKPRYIRPYPVIAKVGDVAYRLTLPPELGNVHDVFHVSMLRKYVADPSHILRPQELEFTDATHFRDEPLRILDRKADEGGAVGKGLKAQPRNLIYDVGTRGRNARDAYPHLFV
ncbi:PREDICTED: uncharacterized protein LOC104808466 [Tarenaya hassleriana]|uniref:uncharacterized protein LOC104808466 n=1 Tax=Tarenaya hassleriana TaxID=28532 RepID=UPI00053C143A|nr:PREDICTED: uncharacterized protein LOC104808466 [Tarenaya hassleriana]